jgi:peptidyl-prolyl cis-trans isomerase C
MNAVIIGAVTRYCRRFWLVGGCAAIFLPWLFLAACGSVAPSPKPSSPTAASSETPALPTQTLTPFLPSPTPPPLAARVNGEAITLEQLQAEVSRYQAAVGTQLATEDEQRVLDDLIDQTLLAQAAYAGGYTLDEAALQERIAALVERLGSQQALIEWQAANGYSEESFRQDLTRAVAAAWMRDQIAASVPLTAEQVHARQIRHYNPEAAAEALAQLRSGADFAALAAQVDPIGKGDLGWFPRGYLLDKKLEEAAFSLEPGEYSEVIEASTGFHILQVIERDPAHSLEPDARLTLQYQVLEAWLQERRAQSEIQVLLP